MSKLMKSENKVIKIVCGALIVEGESFVIVQEAKEHCRGKWSLPTGHAEADENLFTTAIREVKEETNLDIILDGLVGVYQLRSVTGANVIKVIFKGSKTSGQLKFPENEILNAKWITFDDFMSLPITELRTEVLRNIINDYKNRGVYNLDVIRAFGL